MDFMEKAVATEYMNGTPAHMPSGLGVSDLQQTFCP